MVAMMSAAFISALTLRTSTFTTTAHTHIKCLASRPYGREASLLFPCIAPSRRMLRSSPTLLSKVPNACSEEISTLPPKPSLLARLSNLTTALFPLWTVLASIAAITCPSAFTPLTTAPVIQTCLSLLMLSMGLTLNAADLLFAIRRPVPIAFNFITCFFLMPAIAMLLTHLFSLTGTARAGLILLSIVSGGQASNLCTHIAGGDVALSVALTTSTTLAAAVVLPGLSSVLLGTTIPIEPLALATSTARVTLAPLLVGVLLARAAPDTVQSIQPALPAVGVLAVVACVVGPVAQGASKFTGAWQALLLPVFLLHTLGGLIGFLVPRFAGAEQRASIAVAFETAFKSPALGYVLATRCFPPGVELASAISVVILAPLAALSAVLVRKFASREDASKIPS